MLRRVSILALLPTPAAPDSCCSTLLLRIEAGLPRCRELGIADRAAEIAWQRRIGAGFFGGQGFILQKISGPGAAFLDLSGEVVERDLASGERLLVHAGHVGALAPSVSFDIQRVPGFKNILFGGEGLFLAVLTGPGHVVLQSMPLLNLAEEIAHYLPATHETSSSPGNTVGP